MNQDQYFYDDATGVPLFKAVLPDTFKTRAKFTIETTQENNKNVHISAMALDQTNQLELFFESGKTYTSNQDLSNGKTSIFHQPCSATDQLDEHAAEFTGMHVTAVNQFYIPDELMRKIRESGSESIEKNLGVMNQVAHMGGVSVNVQCTETLFDGAMGIYPFMKDGKQKTLYNALWRFGMTVSVGMAPTLFGRSMGQVYSTWTIPYSVNMVADGPVNPETMNIFVTFIKTLTESLQLISQVRQLEDMNLNNMLQGSARIAQQNQARIDQMWAQHNAAWARVEAQRDMLSRDLDQFRANQAASAASMDAFRANLSSMNQSSYDSGGYGSGESLDDKVQRWRHESMMGVNTYERDDGTTYEHTIQDDRVFEHNLDSNTHFGTHNYYDDYVPDHWTELNRKK